MVIFDTFLLLYPVFSLLFMNGVEINRPGSCLSIVCFVKTPLAVFTPCPRPSIGKRIHYSIDESVFLNTPIYHNSVAICLVCDVAFYCFGILIKINVPEHEKVDLVYCLFFNIAAWIKLAKHSNPLLLV